MLQGKNGVHVNGVLHTPASGPCNLTSQVRHCHCWQLSDLRRQPGSVNTTRVHKHQNNLNMPALCAALCCLQDLLQAAELSFYFLLPKQPRKPSTKPRSRAGATGSSAAGGDQQWDEPGTPTLGSPDGDGRHAAACMSSPQFPGGSSPALLPSGAGRPAAAGSRAPGGSGSAAAAGGGASASAAAGGNGLQQYGSGPLLPGMGLSGGPLSPALGFGANLLQPAAYGLGMHDEDEDMMEL
jgi:hypothetical protein